VKAALVDVDTGACVASAHAPDEEMTIQAPRPGWAEQDPDVWWQQLIHATRKLQKQVPFVADEVQSIGISYQMHGLVCVDVSGQVLRPAIIWCDSRAVGIGQEAFQELGESYCLTHYLNSPGNFTASKLKWVMDHEPHIYEKIHQVLLPGDYIAYRLSGVMATTVSGLSEGICWDFRGGAPATKLFDYFGFRPGLFTHTVPTFGEQGRLHAASAEELGLKRGIPVSYRAGDQPNNAYSLKVLEPGELAATAGTSGVVYGVTDQIQPDSLSRVNTFVHVNNTETATRNGVLLCLNGTGISYSWLKRHMGYESYDQMNALAGEVSPGAEGLTFFPFGNGAERVLENKNPGARMQGLDFNIHSRGHLSRAVQEGIAFSLRYGLEVMESMQMPLKVFRAGRSNMFLSPVFRQVFSTITGAAIEMYETDGAQGAARASGVGAGIYRNYGESFRGLQKVLEVEPDASSQEQYSDIYQRWKADLEQFVREDLPAGT
jgi:xylulokinase